MFVTLVKLLFIFSGLFSIGAIATLLVFYILVYKNKWYEQEDDSKKLLNAEIGRTIAILGIITVQMYRFLSAHFILEASSLIFYPIFYIALAWYTSQWTIRVVKAVSLQRAIRERAKLNASPPNPTESEPQMTD